MNEIYNQALQTTIYMSDILRKLLSLNFFFKLFRMGKIFPVNQFDGLYQQNRENVPAEMYLINLNFKSVTAHANLAINWVERQSL